MNTPESAKSGNATPTVYRLCHWPIWIWVFFLAPGPLTFSLFSGGFHWVNWAWLAAVLIGTGIACYKAQLPGSEHRPYILRFDEDKPNPLYRRVCYTFAWNAILNYALLNMAALVYAAATGVWRMKQIYLYAYSPLCAFILLLGMLGKLPRVGTSTQGEGMGTPLFLWIGLGGHRCANHSARPLEDPALKPPPAVSSSLWSSSACSWCSVSRPLAASCLARAPLFPAR